MSSCLPCFNFVNLQCAGYDKYEHKYDHGKYGKYDKYSKDSYGKYEKKHHDK